MLQGSHLYKNDDIIKLTFNSHVGKKKYVFVNVEEILSQNLQPFIKSFYGL